MAYSAQYGLTRQSAALGYYLDASQVDPSQISSWGYVTADAAATVETSGYFNASASQLAKGDSIAAIMSMGGTPVKKSYIVTSGNKATPVTIALATATAG